MIAVPGEAPRQVVRGIEAYLNEESNVLPVDPSGGAVFAQLTEKRDWREFMELGGILMWPILFVAGLAIVIILERVVVLGATRANTDTIMGRIGVKNTKSRNRPAHAAIHR